jgi:hypothetical protein
MHSSRTFQVRDPRFRSQNLQLLPRTRTVRIRPYDKFTTILSSDSSSPADASAWLREHEDDEQAAGRGTSIRILPPKKFQDRGTCRQ